ncbi:MAG: hypothetical protein ACOY90_19575 [Candidatus Zhuqueibacterota bacterium]
MNIGRTNTQHRMGATIILLILLATLMFSCQNRELARLPNDRLKFNIDELADSFEVAGPVYSLSIDKATALVRLSDYNSREYTSFPLDVSFDLTGPNETRSAKKQWQLKSRTITLQYLRDSAVIQEISVLCERDNLKIQISRKLPSQLHTGVYLLRNDERGIDDVQWTQYFSPEPDDYLKPNPTVDARVDQDQQWIFVPAPLNLSFKSDAGWFSIGLAELPDALVYAFRNNALWLDYPWKSMIASSAELFKFPGLIFTFNETPWQAVGQYIDEVNAKYPPKKATESNIDTKWWHRPLVSTWGEQLLYSFTFDNENFNEGWVKDYISQQQQLLDSIRFTIIIEDKWSRAYGDPYPASRFKNLRSLIDWCHDHGHKVILFWRSWKVEAKSLAIDLSISDGEYVDATHPAFESYVDSCCQVMLGNGQNELNADGLKMDHLFLVRDTETAHYANPNAGMGLKELHHYLATFYQRAKQYKPDALIIGSAIDPHFADVQDMVRIGDDWDNKVRREKRARIITEALPGKLLCADAAAMYNKICHYHYVTASLYGIPVICYSNKFQDGDITPLSREIMLQLLKFSQNKPAGKVQFVDYGHWQIVDGRNEVLTESTLSGKGIIHYDNDSRATLYCAENSDLHLVLERHLLLKILDAGKNSIEFSDLGHGIYRIPHLQEGSSYTVHIRKIPELR